MIQDQNHLWQQSPPLPLITLPPANPDPSQTDATASPVAGCSDPTSVFPSQTGESETAVPDEYQWLTLL